MKHQITLIGGQILPVYLGIIEKKPDVVHVLYSKESKDQFSKLKNVFPTKEIHSYQIDPYDFEQIKNKTEEIVFENDQTSFELNITGGTKIMAIACQQVFNDLKLPIFYIDQKHTLFDIADKRSIQLSNKISIETFLKLSGHNKYQIGSLNDFTASEISLSEYILTQMNAGWYWQTYPQLYKKDKFINPKSFSFKYKETELVWDGNTLTINNPSSSHSFITKRGLFIAFSGLWWELLIAKSVSKWKSAIEFKMNLVIKSKVQDSSDKNEIDIVLNTGKNLIFIECKAGEVKQEDVNKMKAVSNLYGGISSRSILVARKKPSDTIIEKCHELGIDVFSQVSAEKALNSNKQIYRFTDLSELPKRLDYLINKMNL
jgi:hypothetical protein